MVVNLTKARKGIFLIIPFCIFILADIDAQSPGLNLIWENSWATGVNFFCDQPDVRNDQIKITIAGKKSPILGKLVSEGNMYSFYPVVPFTYNLEYQVILDEEVIQGFTIPVPDNLEHPNVQNIYPTSETIPANLLKIHIRFSQPMQEGKSDDFIFMINEKGDTVQNVFLDLQPELWNVDRTSLTMWLDPGRIKRDLQPNLKMGPPLIAGSDYQLVISKSWRNHHGLELARDVIRTYRVVQEDRIKPNIDNWEYSYPAVDSRDGLIIDFGESIDYELAIDAIQIYSGDQHVDGNIILNKGESQWIFSPDKLWTTGKYEIVIQSRLEDLAGNNLNHPFDRDLNSMSAPNNAQDQVIILFSLPKNMAQ